ncbi:MAG: hypothetical protein R2881_04910 [Eubacteriales bacterium]
MRTIVTLAQRAECKRGLASLWNKAGMVLEPLPLLPKMNWPAKQLMDGFFSSVQIKAVFTSILADFVVKPEEFQGLGVALVNPEPAFDQRVPLQISPCADQPSYTCIDGGCRTLVDLLANFIRENGGINTHRRTCYRRPLEHGKVTGITLSDGSTYDANVVLASGGVKETFRLADPAQLGAPFLKAVDEAPLMESVFMLHLGLNIDPSQYSLYGINYCYRNGYLRSVDKLLHETYHEGETGI